MSSITIDYNGQQCHIALSDYGMVQSVSIGDSVIWVNDNNDHQVHILPIMRIQDNLRSILATIAQINDGDYDND